MEITAQQALIIAFLIPFGSVAIVILGQWALSKLFPDEPQRDAYSPSPIKIPVAKAATDLVPLIDKLPHEGSTLWTLGVDGLYFDTENGPVWRDAIERWVNGGMHIQYILLEPGEGLENTIKSIIRNVNGKKGSFKVSVLGDSTDGLGGILSEMKT